VWHGAIWLLRRELRGVFPGRRGLAGGLVGGLLAAGAAGAAAAVAGGRRAGG
jgi:hypothetical protein